MTAPTLVTVTDLALLRGLAAGKTQSEIGVELHLEQSTISKMLRALEERTGLAIVELAGRRLGLSAIGRELATVGARALQAFDDLDRLVVDLRDANAGAIRFVTSSTPGSYVMPALIAEFLREHPAVRVDMEILPVPGLWESFAADTFDFAIAPELGLPPDLRAAPLYDDRIVFFAMPGAPLASRAEIQLADFANETLVGKFVESHWRRIFRELEARGLRAGRTVTIIAPEGVKRMVAAGLGIGALFESSVRRDLAEGRLVRLPISDPSLRQRFCLATRRSTIWSPAAAALRTFLVDRLSYSLAE